MTPLTRANLRRRLATLEKRTAIQAPWSIERLTAVSKTVHQWLADQGLTAHQALDGSHHPPGGPQNLECIVQARLQLDAWERSFPT